MDFIEFIKVIRPEDYVAEANEEILLLNSESMGIYNSGNQYQQAEGECCLRKH